MLRIGSLGATLLRLTRLIKRRRELILQRIELKTLGSKTPSQKSDAGLAGLRASTAQQQAVNAGVSGQAALLNAETASTKANNATNPESIDYKKGLSEISENNAQEENYRSQADERDQKIDRCSRVPSMCSEIYNYAQASQTNGLGPEDYQRISSLIDENESQGSFNLGYLTSPQTARSMAAIQTYHG